MPHITWLNGPPEKVPPVYQLRDFSPADLDTLVRKFPATPVPRPLEQASPGAPLTTFAATGSWRWNATPIQWPQAAMMMSRTDAIVRARSYFADKDLWDEAAEKARVYTSYTLLSSDPKLETPVQQRPVALHVTFRFQVDGVLTQGPSSQMQATFASDDDGPRVVEAFRFWRDLGAPLPEQLLPLTLLELGRTLQNGLQRAKIAAPVSARLQLNYLTAPPHRRQRFLAPVLVVDVLAQRENQGSPALRFYVPAWRMTNDSHRSWFGPLEPMILFPIQ